ncbi:MAG: S9 family peptidase [Myxococcota bacterium]|nr:S9 family peptidase [Myxococcota bacterium]
MTAGPSALFCCSPRSCRHLPASWLALTGLLLASASLQAAPLPDRAGPAPAATDRPFTVHDLVQLARVSDPQVSPTGRQVAFVLRTTDLDANRGRFDIWLMAADGSGLRRLTADPAADTSPRWAPDGQSLFFLSSRGGSSQVWQLDLRGGEAQPVGSFPLDVQELLVLPDGRLLLFFEVYPDCRELQCTIDRDAARATVKASGKLYDRLFVRHWDTWKDGKRRHPFVWQPGGPPPRDLLPGVDGDCPSKPWGGVEEVAVSPDGREAVLTARVAGREEAWSVDFNLWRVSLGEPGEPTCLTCDNLAWDTTPAYSPDGKTLAYLAMARPGFEADRFGIKLRDLATGRVRAVADGWDRSAGGLLWAADGKRLFTVAENLGQRSLFAIDPAAGRVTTLLAQGSVGMPVLLGRDRLLFSLDTLTAPADLFSLQLDGKNLRQLTRLNEDRLRGVGFGVPEQFTFTGADADTVYGYLVPPVWRDPAAPVPVAFLIHGGPQGSFGNHFHYRWNPQTYAGAGYAAVMIDFHGSTGYGQAFTDRIRGDWGGAPYEDLMKGLDAALARYPWLDGSRVCALGASYGGYMVNWIAGQTDRFRCLVVHDGNLDEKMAYYDTEELWFPEWEHGGTPWENPEGYAKHNPVDHVARWKTPMLVIHGGLDYRVVDTQGISTFNVLQRRGIPSKFLYFPDENHWVLKPHNSIQWHETVTGWLDQWLK